jgi:hypothetical protein
MNCETEKMWKEAIMTYLNTLFGIRLGGLRKTTGNLNEDIRHPG